MLQLSILRPPILYFIFFKGWGKREGEGIGKKIIKLKIKSIYLGSGHNKRYFTYTAEGTYILKAPGSHRYEKENIEDRGIKTKEKSMSLA